MNNFKMDKRKILQRIPRVLQWENKPPKLKRSIADSRKAVVYEYEIPLLS